MSRLPCGWVYPLPRFCKGRMCKNCILLKDKQTNNKEATK